MDFQDKQQSAVAIQAALFSDFEDRHDLLEKVRERSHVHTGKIRAKDDLLCREICLDLLAGLSRRQCALKYRISRNTVNSIREIMEERGEVEPLRKELSRQLGRVIAAGLEEIYEAINEGRVNPAQLPIPMAALIDKKLLLDGEATSRTETTVREITIEDVQAEFARLRQLNTPAIESESSVIPSEPKQIE